MFIGNVMRSWATLKDPVILYGADFLDSLFIKSEIDDINNKTLKYQ